MMNMKRFLSGTVVLGLITMPTMAGVTVTPMQGTMGSPFNNGSVSGFGWNAAAGGGAGPLIGNLYDNILTINGGAATPAVCPPFQTCVSAQAFVDWTNSTAQWGDDLHGLAGPAQGGPTAVITSIRYGYSNDVATTTHIIQIYDMMLSWDQLNQLASAGVEIGAHTRTHPMLVESSDDQLSQEVRGSKEDIEQRLGRSPDTFAFPFGEYNAKVLGVVSETGYEAACTVKPGMNTPGIEAMELRRIEIFGTDNAWRFKLKVRFGARRPQLLQLIQGF